MVPSPIAQPLGKHGLNWPPSPVLVTCVVGAGPAGMLFCLVAGIRRQSLPDPGVWPIVLADKRTSYERTHRLRMDPKPYRATQRKLDDPRFDELISFLDSVDFRPAANLLEQKLEQLVGQLGIEKRQLTVGPGEHETDVDGLRALLVDERVLSVRSPLTIVGADSVASATRELVKGETSSVERVHQTVVRLRIEGNNLPTSLGAVRQFKLSKLIGSALDYRSNPNGFAEADLFLSPAEHEAVVALGARPADPVELTESTLERLDARLFTSVVRHLESEIGSGPARVFVQSTFRLEHRFHETVAFAHPDALTHTFLVGDAAVSLPFFRGMACLMQCVDSLVDVHATLVDEQPTNERIDAAASRYDSEVAEIRRAELAIVESRARAIRGARELVRVSSMAPFPMQTWLLSERSSKRATGWLSAGVALTVFLLAIAAVAAVSSPAVGVVGLISIPLQAAAGIIYRRDLEDEANPWIEMVCRLQVLVLMVSGLFIAVADPYNSGWPIRVGAAIGWFVLGLAFVAGMYIAEAAHGRRLARSSPDQ